MSTAPVVGVLALQGDVREHVAMLERAGATAVTVRRPAELDRVDGLVMPGGESTTMSKLARTFELLDPLRERLRGGLPGFGTCAGMIMLADRIEGGVVGQETFGGLDVVVRRNAFGRAPWVEKVGSDVRVVAKVASGHEVGRIVAVRQANLLATSFHPEITGDHRFHQLFVDQVREATG